MANPTIERAALTRLLNTPNLTVLVVNVVIQGQIQVEAIGPGALDRVKVLLLPDSSQNLLDFAPSSWWLNSKSLFSAVDNGFLVVVTETAATGPQAVSRTGSYIPEPMNPQTGDMLVYTGIGWDKLPAGPSGYVITSNGSGSLPTYQPPTGGGGGAVNSVTALTPLSSSGGTDPVISLSGVVAAANGGTGISSPGAVGNVLTSTGAGWASSPPATTSPATPVNSVQFNDAGSFGGSAGLTWDGSTLAVDGAIDRATAGTLTVGGATANAITVGKAGVTTTFPGPVNLNGTVTSVLQTQFVTSAKFDGNVTFGDSSDDNISLVGQIDTALTQEGIIAPAPSPAGTGRIYFDSSTNTFKASQNGGAYVDVITSGVVTGSGTATQIAYFTGSSSIGSETAAGSDSLTWDSTNNRLGVATPTPNEALTVSGAVSVGEGSAPSPTAAFGKLWANNGADARPYWTDDTGQSYNLTLDRYSSLSYVGVTSTVEIDADPSKPVFNSIAIDKDTTFSAVNLGDGRSASVRVVCDGSTRTLTFPVDWTWIGSGAPPSIAAGKVGYLSFTAYGPLDSDVVASWGYEDMPVAVSGTGTDNQIAVWSGTNSQDGSSTLTFNSSTNAMRLDGSLGINGAPTVALDVASGQIAIPDGTAAAPAIAFRDDLNTGLFSPANDVVGVGVNGTEIARLQQFGAASTAVFLLGTTAPIGAISGSGNISVDSVSPDATSGVVMLAHGNVGTVIQESYRGGQFAGVRTSGTKISPSAVVAGEGLWNGIGTGYTTAGGYNYGALVTFKAEETYTATASGGRIEFHTTTNGTDGFTTLGSATTERMRITNAGRVGIGTSTPATALDVVGVITASTGVVAPLQTNAQTASLTLALSDASKVVEVAVTSPSTATVTVPANGAVAFPIGTQILVMQTDTGTVSIAADVGVTIDYRSGLGLNLNGQWAVATLVKRATDTWVLFGDLV